MPKKDKSKKQPKADNTVKTPAKKLVFDATKTIAALKLIEKKRAPELLKKIHDARSKSSIKKEKPDHVLPKIGPFFRSSLPLNVTPEAQAIFRKLKASKKGVIKFPPNMNEGGEVILIDNSTTPAEKKVIGIFRKLFIETDPMKMDIAQMGLFVRTLDSDPEKLDFIIKVPSLPGILRSRKFNDQGGLTRQLRISQVKKGE